VRAGHGFLRTSGLRWEELATITEFPVATSSEECERRQYVDPDVGGRGAHGTHPAAGAYAHRAPPRHNVPSRPDAASCAPLTPSSAGPTFAASLQHLPRVSRVAELHR